jgi:hypothetical protein
MASFVAVSRELISHPFAAGDDLAKRPGAPRKYLLTAVAAFAVTVLLAYAVSSAQESTALSRVRWVALGLVLVSAVAGNAVAFVMARTTNRTVESWRFAAAVQYLVGLSLAGLAVVTFAGFVGEAILPNWQGSLLEAVVMVCYLGVGVAAVLLLLECPRRIMHLAESTYYGVVAILFLLVATAAQGLTV